MHIAHLDWNEFDILSFLGDSNLEDKHTVPDVHNFGFMTSILIKLPIVMCI